MNSRIHRKRSRVNEKEPGDEALLLNPELLINHADKAKHPGVHVAPVAEKHPYLEEYVKHLENKSPTQDAMERVHLFEEKLKSIRMKDSIPKRISTKLNHLNPTSLVHLSRDPNGAGKRKNKAGYKHNGHVDDPEFLIRIFMIRLFDDVNSVEGHGADIFQDMEINHKREKLEPHLHQKPKIDASLESLHEWSAVSSKMLKSEKTVECWRVRKELDFLNLYKEIFPEKWNPVHQRIQDKLDDLSNDCGMSINHLLFMMSLSLLIFCLVICMAKVFYGIYIARRLSEIRHAYIQLENMEEELKK